MHTPTTVTTAPAAPNDSYDPICHIYQGSDGRFRVDFGHGNEVSWDDPQTVSEELQKALRAAFSRLRKSIRGKSYQHGEEVGYDKGYKRGHQEGYDEGYAKGYENGLAGGKSQ